MNVTKFLAGASLVVCLSPLSALASFYETVSLPAEAEIFVDDGTRPIMFEIANLNRDKCEDAILVLEEVRQPGEEDWSGLKRTLVLLLRTQDGALTLRKRSTVALPEDDCGGGLGDCLESISVKPGAFSIDLYGGGGKTRWIHSYEFSYEEAGGDWYLSEYTDSRFEVGEGDTTNEETATCVPERDFGRISIADYSHGDIPWCEASVSK